MTSEHQALKRVTPSNSKVGSRKDAGARLEGAAPDSVVARLAEALRARGFDVELSVGHSPFSV